MAYKRNIEIFEEAYTKKDGRSTLSYQSRDGKKRYVAGSPDPDTKPDCGIESIEVEESHESGGNNVITITTTDDKTTTFNVMNGDKGDKGDQGNSGYSGAAGELEVVNNLTDGGETAALSAEMGKELNEKIEGTVEKNYTNQTLTADNYYNTNLTYVGTHPSALLGTYCFRASANAGDKFRIFGNGNSGAIQLYAFYRDGNNYEYTQKCGSALDTRENGLEVTVPSGSTGIVVNLYQYDSTKDKVEKVTETTTGGYKEYCDNAIEDAIEEAVKKPLDGKTIVCFGDSITEFTYNGKSYPDYLADITGATVINCGVGGTMLAQRVTPVLNPSNINQGYAGLDIVSMVLAACGVAFDTTHDYDDIVTNAATWVKENQSDDNTAIVARLLAINWQNVDYVTVFGGTNDWHNNAGHFGTVTLDDKTPTNTCGAINLIIDKLLTKYPHLSIYWFTPIIRCVSDYFSPSSSYSVGDVVIYSGATYKFVANHSGAWDANDVISATIKDFRQAKYFSDNYIKGGMTLKGFSSSVTELIEKNHIPICDMYDTLGWNLYNFGQYFLDNDNTHPYKGFRQLAEKISKFILSQ